MSVLYSVPLICLSVLLPVPNCFITGALHNILVALVVPYNAFFRIFQALFACLFLQINFNIICQVQKTLFFTSSNICDLLISQPQQNRNKVRRMKWDGDLSEAGSDGSGRNS